MAYALPPRLLLIVDSLPLSFEVVASIFVVSSRHWDVNDKDGVQGQICTLLGWKQNTNATANTRIHEDGKWIPWFLGNGPQEEWSFGCRTCFWESNGQKLHTPQGKRQPWSHRPTASFIYERPPFRAAAATQPTFGLVLWRRGGRRRLGGWVAVALLSSHRVFALYEVGEWEYPFNQLDECFRGSVEPHMHRISSGIARIERSGGEVVKLLNVVPIYTWIRG